MALTTTKLAELFDAAYPSTTSTEALVKAAYADLLGLSGVFYNQDNRVNYWVEQLNSGAVSKDDFAQVFLNSAGQGGEYLRDEDVNHNIDQVNKLMALPDSVTTLEALKEQLNAGQNDGDSGSEDGQPSLKLTSDTDNLTGTSEDDVFTANIQQNPWAGGVSNSLSSADTLKGGAGNDTLNAELVPEFFGVTGDNQVDVQPRTESIEEVYIEARESQQGEAVLDAKHMTDISKIGSTYSDGNLVIENLTTLTSAGDIRNTEEITVVMDHTDNFNSDNDASDLTVYFDEDYLVSGESTTGSSLTARLVNAVSNEAGNNSIDKFTSLVFTVGGTEVNVDLSSIAADTSLDYTTVYDQVVDAVNAQLAAQGFTTVTASKAPIENAVFSIPVAGFTAGDAAGQYYPITITNTGAEELAGVTIGTAEDASDTDLNNSFAETDAVTSNNPVTVNVELEKVGRDGEGGNLTIGGKDQNSEDDSDKDQQDGIDVFNVAVRGNDDQPNNLGVIRSTNQQLNTINITNHSSWDGADLTVRDMIGGGQELTLINAASFSGDFSLAMSNAGSQQALTSNFGGGNDSYDWMSSEADGVSSGKDYSISMGAGNDTVTANLDGDSVDTAGETFTLTTGSGDDTATITMAAGVSQETMAELDNLNINLGSGDDTLDLDAYGNFNIDAGAGNDFVHINSLSTGNNGNGSAGTWTFGADSVANETVGNTFAAANTGDARVLYEAKLTVSFAGFEVTVDVDTDSAGNFLATQTDINAAIKNAIESDTDGLAKLLTVTEGAHEQLTVTANIAGENDLSIDLFQPQLTSAAVATGQVAYSSSDQAALVKGLVATGGIATVDTNAVTDAAVIADVNTLGVGSLNVDGTQATGTIDYNVAADDHHNVADADANAYLEHSDSGGDNATTGINFSTIKVGSGDDVVALHSNTASSNTLDLNDSFGTVKVVNYHNTDANTVADAAADVGVHALDFTKLLTDKTSASGSVDSQVVENITLNVENTTLGTALTNSTADTTDTDLAKANSVNILGFDEEVNTASIKFDQITLANLVAQLNDDTAAANDFGGLTGTDLDADDAPANFVGTTQNHVIMVENNQNPGEYKVFHVTSTVDATTGVVQNNGDFTGVADLGTIDFGASINFALTGNSEYEAFKAAYVDFVDNGTAGQTFAQFVAAQADHTVATKFTDKVGTVVANTPTTTTATPDLVTSAPSFNTINGTNIVDGNTASSADQVIQIADPFHLTGSTIDGGAGTTTVQFGYNGAYDLSALTLGDVDVIDAANATTLTATAAQLDGLTVNNGNTVVVEAVAGTEDLTNLSGTVTVELTAAATDFTDGTDELQDITTLNAEASTDVDVNVTLTAAQLKSVTISNEDGDDAITVDTLSGETGIAATAADDTFVFGASDTGVGITGFTAGTGTDGLNFDAFVDVDGVIGSAGSVTGTNAITAGADTATVTTGNNVDIAGKVLVLDSDVVGSTGFQALINDDTSGTHAFTLADDDKAIILNGDVADSAGTYSAYMVTGAGGATDTITLVGTVAVSDADALTADQFIFA